MAVARARLLVSNNGMTQQQVAKNAGINQVSLAQAETVIQFAPARLNGFNGRMASKAIYSHQRIKALKPHALAILLAGLSCLSYVFGQEAVPAVEAPKSLHERAEPGSAQGQL